LRVDDEHGVSSLFAVRVCARGYSFSGVRLIQEDRRDPRRRKPLHPLAAIAFGRAFPLRRARIIAIPAWPRVGARLAFAPQFIETGADRREIVGGSGATHRTIPPTAGDAGVPDIVKPKRAEPSNPASNHDKHNVQSRIPPIAAGTSVGLNIAIAFMEGHPQWMPPF
jgi:hypothetical protein